VPPVIATRRQVKGFVVRIVFSVKGEIVADDSEPGKDRSIDMMIVQHEGWSRD
jgi:hypothetical protein